MKLLSTNTKIDKTNKATSKYYTKILQLAPHKTSGKNVCASASPACSSDCLFYAGMGVYKNVQAARIRKTNLFFEDRALFIATLKEDLASLKQYCDKKKIKPAVRLNGLSDIPWEQIEPSIFIDFPTIQFFDYTKIKKRYQNFLEGNFPPNYHLTFSRSEINESACLEFLNKYENAQIAVVFEKIPKKWNGYSVKSGDDNDLRFLDKKPICGLIAKGRAKKDTTGFVVR